MPEAHAALQEHLTRCRSKRKRQRSACGLSWRPKCYFFGAMFMSYIAYRHAYPRAFVEASHHTIVLYGTNQYGNSTDQQPHHGFRRSTPLRKTTPNGLFRFLAITILFGLAFWPVKGVEYHETSPNISGRPAFQSRAAAPKAQIFWFLYWVNDRCSRDPLSPWVLGCSP